MSQKSSVPQAVSFVSQVLKRDTFWHYPTMAILERHAFIPTQIAVNR